MNEEEALEVRRQIADAKGLVAEEIGYHAAIGYGFATALSLVHYAGWGWLAWGVGVVSGICTYMLATRRYLKDSDRAWGMDRR